MCPTMEFLMFGESEEETRQVLGLDDGDGRICITTEEERKDG